MKCTQMRQKTPLMNVWPCNPRPSASEQRVSNPPSMEHLVWRHYPRLGSIRLPETLMMPVESVKGVSVFLVLMILFSLGEPMKKKQSIFCICWERCVLSAFFPNCLDKLITLHIIYFFFFFIPVWKSWVWRFKAAPLEVASVTVGGNIYYIFMKVGNNPSTACFCFSTDQMWDSSLDEASEGWCLI